MTDRQHFIFLQTCFLLFSFAVLRVFFPVGGLIDLNTIASWMSPVGDFPLRDHWALAELNHRWVKNVLIGTYVLILLQWLASFKFKTFHTQRFEMGYFFCVAMLCTAVVGILKSQSSHAFMTGYFVYRLTQPKRAYFFLFSGFILGFAMGWAQMMRGAHFLSHNLWTAWIVWCINVLIYSCYYSRFSTLALHSPPLNKTNSA